MKPIAAIRLIPVLLGIRRDERIGFRLLARVARRWVPGYRLTWPELAWFYSPGLNTVLKKYGEADGFNAHRRLALQQLLRLTAEVPGDTAECGVYLGCGSEIILQSNQRAPLKREHFVFDSFEGLSAPSGRDGGYWSAHDLSVDEQSVRQNLSSYERVTYLRGWIPERFDEVRDRRFSFAHIDVDLYEPTLASLQFFYERLNPGGLLVCDDYGFLTCPGATQAVDEYLADKPEKMLLLPGGGGFFIKGCATSME
jgi:hypothetical protein